MLLILFLNGTFLQAAPAALSATAPEKKYNRVYVIPVNGEISDPLFYFIRRSLKEAEREGTDLIVIHMDTYGGSLKACVEIMKALEKTKSPTVTYIDQNAGSAGALIAVATQKIYMAPVGAIGASAPVSGSGEDVGETMKDKTVSYFSGYARSAAERNGYNKDIAQAFIDKNHEVIIDGEKIHKPGSVLTLSSQEAIRKIGKEGKPVLASGTYESLEALLKDKAPGAEIRKMEPTGAETTAFWINAISPLLFLGIIVGFYIEFKTPGFGLPGIIAIMCLIVYFIGLFIAGLSGYEPMLVFVIGLALVMVELFLLPGHIIPGLAGVILMLGSLLYAGVDRFPSDPKIPSLEQFKPPLTDMGIGLAGALLIIALIARFLPNTPLYGALVQAGPTSSTPPPPERLSRLEPGQRALTESPLRPAGKARFGEQLIDVMTQGEMIAKNTEVEIVRIEGSKITVKAVTPSKT